MNRVELFGRTVTGKDMGENYSFSPHPPTWENCGSHFKSKSSRVPRISRHCGINSQRLLRNKIHSPKEESYVKAPFLPKSRPSVLPALSFRGCDHIVVYKDLCWGRLGGLSQ